jgi:glycine cleavage system regulatory protein
MQTHLVLTVITEDHPGIIEQLSSTVTAMNGNWLESSMIKLAGKFAGVILVQLDTDRQKELTDALHSLKEAGIRVTVETCRPDFESQSGHPVLLKIVANDRPGIVQEFSQLFSSLNVNVEALDTYCESAAMSSEQLFEATVTVVLPAEMDMDDLASNLESLSDDLIVEFIDFEEE